MNWRTTFAVVLFTVSLLVIGVRTQQVLYDYYGRKLRITPTACPSLSPRFAHLSGVCMFNLECQEQSGIVIGACVDRFLFGACCHIPENLRKPSTTTESSDSLSSLPALPIPSSLVSSSNSTSNVISLISEISSTVASETVQKLHTSSTTTSSSSSSSSRVSSTTATFTPIKNVSVSVRPSSLSASTSTVSPISSTSKDYSTRFPVRNSVNPLGSGSNTSPPRRVPSHGIQDETLGTLNPSSYVIPNRERTTLPSTRDIVTVLPFALETFSSVGDSSDDRPYGGYHTVHHPHGQSYDPMEHETLSSKDRMKPRPSSTRLQVRPLPTSSFKNNNNDNNLLDSTEEPPKISTFMYVDDKAHSSSNSLSLKNKLNLYTSTTTKDGVVEEKTVPYYNEDLNSNTENIWSVVMQLGSQNNGGGGGSSPSPSSFPMDSEISKLDDLSVLTASSADQSSSSDAFFGNTMPSIGGLMLDNTFLKLKTESAIPTTTTNKLVGDDNNDSTTEQESELSENENDNLYKTTMKPWASSTYFVHTFTYPNFTGNTGDSGDSEENEFDKNNKNSLPSTTIPSVGKITTWSGIGSVVDKEDLIIRHTDSSEEEDDENSASSSIPNHKKPLTTLSTVLQTRSTTTTTTTTRPSTTTTTVTTTKKHYSTRRTTPKTTTTEQPEITNRRPVTTEKWKKPKPYTLPPHKRPTTPDPTTPRTEPTSRRTTTTTTTKKPHRVITKPPQIKEKNKPVAPSIIMDEEMDTNLDDFVEQVVQGIAGTLDNLNIDDVILPPPSANEQSSDPTADPLQVISDPLFPPFPVVKEGALTKLIAKTEKEQKTASTTTTTTTQKPLDWRKDCGVRTQKKSGRIVGGTASSFGRWPWQALVKEATWLGLFSKNKCGGVLITPKYVLTAAHCQPGFLATLTVVLGDFDISSSSENHANAITKNVRRVIVHRDYNAQTFENDIALLELDSAVDFQSYIVPICLPNDDEEFIGKKAYVTGWGRLKYGGGVPQILHEVDVPILKNEECQDMFHKSGHLKAIRDSFICAGYAEGFKDSCEGDSGGPLSIQRSTGQWVLAGTVSHGIKCAYPNLPGVYMRMTFYKPWIKRVTGLK